MMERSTKIIIGVIVLGVILPLAIILPLTSRQNNRDQDLAGIHDYNAGRYDAAIRELSVYSKAHPLTADHGLFGGKSNYAQYYLGLALLKQHRNAEAVNVFRVYARYWDSREGNYLLGVALMRNGSKVEARATFQQLIHSEMGEGMSTRNEALVNLSEKMVDRIDHSR